MTSSDDMVRKRFYTDAQYFCELIYRHNTELMAWIFSSGDKSETLAHLSVDDLHMVNCTLSRIGADLAFFYENIVPRLTDCKPDMDWFEHSLQLFVKRVKDCAGLPTTEEKE